MVVPPAGMHAVRQCGAAADAAHATHHVKRNPRPSEEDTWTHACMRVRPTVQTQEQVLLLLDTCMHIICMDSVVVDG